MNIEIMPRDGNSPSQSHALEAYDILQLDYSTSEWDLVFEDWFTNWAAIYIRKCSERQARKYPPQAQEDGFKAFCEETWYLDIKRYCSGDKMVTP